MAKCEPHALRIPPLENLGGYGCVVEQAVLSLHGASGGETVWEASAWAEHRVEGKWAKDWAWTVSRRPLNQKNARKNALLDCEWWMRQVDKARARHGSEEDSYDVRAASSSIWRSALQLLAGVR